MKQSLAQIEIKRTAWGALREAAGTAENIPLALSSLLDANTPDAVEQAYWCLENHVVVQGQLFQAAEPTVSVLIAALLDPRPKHVRIGVLELLFQILSANAHVEEVQYDNTELASKCKAKAREGLWVLYAELRNGEREAAREVIALLEEDPARLEACQAG